MKRCFYLFNQKLFGVPGLILLFFPFTGLAQLSTAEETQVDSLKTVIAHAEHDSVMVNAWVEWSDIVSYYNPGLELNLLSKIDSLCSINLNKPLSGKELEFFTDHKIKNLLAFGTNYRAKGDYAKTIKYFTKALKGYERIEDMDGKAAALRAIGTVHTEMEDFEKAKEYFNEALEIFVEIKDTLGQGTILSNMANLYAEDGDYDKALESFQLSLDQFEQNGSQYNICVTLLNMAVLYGNMGNQTESLKYYEKSLEISTEINDHYTSALLIVNLCLAHYLDGDSYLAIKYGEKGLEELKDVDAINLSKHAHQFLSLAYEDIGNYEEALNNYKTYNLLKDSLDSEENEREVIRQEYQYEYEKKAAADSIRAVEEAKVVNAELKVQKAQNKQRKQFAYFLYGSLALVLFFGLFMFNRFRITVKQKKIIEDQKNQVDTAFTQLEEKNREVLDSINYARRIQTAILPSQEVMDSYLKEFFVLYEPKDIVAGDFYWVDKSNDGVLFAAADCTGHGVPGAMVSVICNNALNRSVREHKLIDPGDILDKTREIVCREFEKSKDDVKDGMDIALCSINGTKLSYAGANNPVWIVKHETHELIEIKADKQPIGKFDRARPFTSHTIECQKGDTVYVFSDGYPDQFGGEKGKKFKLKSLRQLIVSIQNKPMEKQYQLLRENFIKWKGDIEQVDDICIIGVKI